MFFEIVADWKFWSVVVSLTAVILSQLPPIHILLRKAKLDLEVHRRIFINHKVGNSNLQMHLIIRNVGGRVLRIKKMNARIIKDGKEIVTLPAQSYIASPKDNQLILLTSFDIKPDEQWSHSVSFVNYFDRNMERKYRESEILLKNEIERKRALLQEDKVVFASEEFVVPFIDIFDDRFHWLPGDYVIEISLTTDIDKVDIVKQYRFTIFESQTDELKKYKEDYSTGAGIFWDSPLHAGQWLEIEEKK